MGVLGDYQTGDQKLGMYFRPSDFHARIPEMIAMRAGDLILIAYVDPSLGAYAYQVDIPQADDAPLMGLSMIIEFTPGINEKSRFRAMFTSLDGRKKVIVGENDWGSWYQATVSFLPTE